MTDADKAHIRAIAEDAGLGNTLYLLSRGIPYEMVRALKAGEVEAYVIALGLAEGGTFDWDAWAWKDKDGSPARAVGLNRRTVAESVARRQADPAPSRGPSAPPAPRPDADTIELVSHALGGGEFRRIVPRDP